MQELEAIEVIVTRLEPGGECTLIVQQPHSDAVLLSHFEVTELSPQGRFVQLIDLRIERLSYLVTPVPLVLLEGEQRRARWRAELRAQQQLQALIQLEPRLARLSPQRAQQLTKQDRRATRLIALDARWKPQQQLTLVLRNPSTSALDKVVIELVLYSFGCALPIVN